MDKTLQAQLETKVLDTYLLAQQKYGRMFNMPIIEFRDMGRVAGRATYPNKLTFSPTLFSENVERFLARTVPHEIAHLISYALYGEEGWGHKHRWRSVMATLGVPIHEITRCHNYDVSSVARVSVKYNASCNCRNHIISKTIRNRILLGRQYRCRTCRETLELV